MPDIVLKTFIHINLFNPPNHLKVYSNFCPSVRARFISQHSYSLLAFLHLWYVYIPSTKMLSDVDRYGICYSLSCHNYLWRVKFQE